MKTYDQIVKMIKSNENYLKQDGLTELQIIGAKRHIEALNWVIMSDSEFAFMVESLNNDIFC